MVPISLRLAAATAVVTFVAKRQNWVPNGLCWIPFLDDEHSDNRRKRESALVSQFDVRMLLAIADEKILNITNGTVLPTTKLNRQTLNQAIENLSNAIRNGDLSQIPLMVNDTQMILGVLSVGQCVDIICTAKNIFNNN